MRIRQHVNPLRSDLVKFRGDRPRLPGDRPIELEIGCADAQFLFERAAADGDRTYLGLEIREPIVELVNQKAAELGAPVQGIFGHANRHLRELLPPSSVDRVFLNFPDPWFKRRHRKRRVMDDALVDDIHTILRPGGELFFQSDVWSVSLDALEVLERHDRQLANAAGAWTFWKQGNPYRARSWREAHCEAAGMEIWRLLYVNR